MSDKTSGRAPRYTSDPQTPKPRNARSNSNLRLQNDNISRNRNHIPTFPNSIEILRNAQAHMAPRFLDDLPDLDDLPLLDRYGTVTPLRSSVCPTTPAAYSFRQNQPISYSPDLGLPTEEVIITNDNELSVRSRSKQPVKWSDRLRPREERQPVLEAHPPNDWLIRDDVDGGGFESRTCMDSVVFNSSEVDNTGSECEFYDVERIVREKIGRSTHEFLIKWVGYETLDWVPAVDCHCQQLIDEFHLSPRTRLISGQVDSEGSGTLLDMHSHHRSFDCDLSSSSVEDSPSYRMRDQKTGRFLRPKITVVDLRGVDESPNSGCEKRFSSSRRANTARFPKSRTNSVFWDTPHDFKVGEIIWIRSQPSNPTTYLPRSCQLPEENMVKEEVPFVENGDPEVVLADWIAEFMAEVEEDQRREAGETEMQIQRIEHAEICRRKIEDLVEEIEQQNRETEFAKKKALKAATENTQINRGIELATQTDWEAAAEKRKYRKEKRAARRQTEKRKANRVEEAARVETVKDLVRRKSLKELEKKRMERLRKLEETVLKSCKDETRQKRQAEARETELKRQEEDRLERQRRVTENLRRFEAEPRKRGNRAKSMAVTQQELEEAEKAARKEARKDSRKEIRRETERKALRRKRKLEKLAAQVQADAPIGPTPILPNTIELSSMKARGKEPSSTAKKRSENNQKLRLARKKEAKSKEAGASSIVRNQFCGSLGAKQAKRLVDKAREQSLFVESIHFHGLSSHDTPMPSVEI